MVIAELPLTVMKRYILKLHISVKYITANVIDTATGKLVASASTVEHCIKESFDCGRSSTPKAAVIVGEVLAKRLKVESLLHGGEMEARGIHADVSNEIRKEGSKNSSMIWSIVGALKTDGLKLIVDDENESGPSSFSVTTHSLTRLASRSPIIAALVRWRDMTFSNRIQKTSRCKDLCMSVSF